MTPPPRPAALGALALVAVLGLTGCGGDDDTGSGPAPTASQSLTPSTGPSGTPTSDPGAPLDPAAGLPSSFPVSEVPLIPGAVTQPLGPGSGDPSEGWVLEVASAKDRKACFDEAVAALVAKGFELSAGPLTSEANIEALYLSPGYRVIVTATARDGACSLAYEVAPNKAQ